MSPPPADRWRIGVLAARVGVSESVLRAWESRYGLFSPTRTAGGYRLYGPEDERRARAVVEARERGVPASQAAAEALASSRGVPVDPAQPVDDASLIDPTARGARLAVEALRAAMARFDADAMHGVLDRVLASRSIESAVSDVLLPFLRIVGEDWAGGAVDVADEHFASDVVRGRLAALANAEAAATGPVAVLACPPEESHDLALKAFQVVLQRSGWRTRYLGARTPTTSLLAATRVIRPDVVVLAGTVPEVFAEPEPALATGTRLFLAGAGAGPAAAAAWGGELLTGDPVEAARTLSRTAR